MVEPVCSNCAHKVIIETEREDAVKTYTFVNPKSSGYVFERHNLGNDNNKKHYKNG